VIVPMRMVAVLCVQREAERALVALRELGVVHLLPGRPPEGGDLDAARQQLARLERALQQLPATAAAPALALGGDADALAADALAAEALALLAERRELDKAAADLQAERAPYAPFGDFDPEQARALAAQGLALRLYALPARGPLPVPAAGAVLQVVHRDRNLRAAVLVGPADAGLPLRELPLPARSLAAGERQLAAHAARRQQLDARLLAIAAARPRLRARAAAQQETVEMLAAAAGMRREEPVAWLAGACPLPALPRLEAAARMHGWAVIAREPGADDPVPTLLQSPRWVQQVHAVLRMLGITPGYAEPDSSALLLVFLVLFAAMLIGDAGYGALLLAATLVRRGPASQAQRLIRTIGVATIGWGTITGAWFALPTSTLPPLFLRLRWSWLADPDDARTTTQHVMLLCFVLGAVHLSIAHLWAFVRAGRTLAALAQLGWIASTWTMFAIARTMVLGAEFPPWMAAVGAGGVLMITLFMTPIGKLKDEWFNHVMLPLSLVSNFVDVVSYLRLFAVGTAGFAVAQSFNGMAANAAAGGGLGLVVAALIALFGHSLNLALCAMGVLVHGVRLNTLEFSAHLGLQWNGVDYRPFARRTAAAAAPSLAPGPTTSEERPWTQ